MKADPTQQRRLLDLQAVDTLIAQALHKRRSIPELEKIAKAQAVRSALGERITAAQTRVYDYQNELAKAEADLVPVRQRRERDIARRDDGSVTDPKQLRALIDEIDHLERRTGELEDVQLEAMERLEAAQGALAALEGRRSDTEPELRELVSARDEQLAEIEAELARLRGDRATIADQIEAPLMAAYTRDHERSGIGAAELKHGRCLGCQLQLNAADLRAYAVAPADEVLRCEECNRILVRTPESGL